MKRRSNVQRFIDSLTTTPAQAVRLLTRKEYMARHLDRDAAYRAYYGQWVTPRVMAAVVRHVGPERLRASAWPFNDIPLKDWDRFHPSKFMTDAELLSVNAAGDWVGIGWSVCVAKEAARAWVEAGCPRDTEAEGAA